MSYIIDILVDGRPVKKIKHDHKTYLPLSLGQEYQIRIYNQSAKRICAVPSVDGLSVLNAKEATYDSPGYVIPAWQTSTIEGWRLNEEKVAAFYAAEKPDGYAEKLGKGGNTGVIGCIIYPEKYVSKNLYQEDKWVKRPSPFKYKNKTCSYNEPLAREVPTAGGIKTSCLELDDDSSVRYMSSCSVSTGYGREKESRAVITDFTRDAAYKEKIVLYYDSPEVLREKGILVDLPDPFPAEVKEYWCPKP